MVINLGVCYEVGFCFAFQESTVILMKMEKCSSLLS